MQTEMEVTSTIKELSKSQQIRLVDIWVLGPLMIYMAFNKNVNMIQRIAMAFFGVTTIYYNSVNYLENKKRYGA